MKGGLHQPALGKVKLALANEQTISEHFLDALDCEPFGKMAVLGNQDFLDEIGMIEQEEFVRMIAETEARYIALIPGQVGKKRERIAPHCIERGSRRNSIGRRVGSALLHLCLQPLSR